jgi:DNA invertase Pin-like site-specific DNA recombinase
MFRASLYARMATGDRQTLPMQNRVLCKYASQQSWTVVMQVRKVGSGAAKRRARESLLTAAGRREIDVVPVRWVDRWGERTRNLSGLTAAVRR